MMSDAAGRNWVWPHDQFDPVLAKKAGSFRRLLSFEPPKHSLLARRIAYVANRIYLHLGFRRGRTTPAIPKAELAKLSAIPRGSGNILVGPHPAPLDAHLMFHLLASAHSGPAVFLMAAEAYFGGPNFRRAMLRRLGVIPVARGRKNPEAVQTVTQLVANGWWGGIFPEGEVYFSREVMPMEYGAVRIGVEAALEIRRKARVESATGEGLRPVFLTPFSHVYFFDDHAETERRANAALRELESHPIVSMASFGDLAARVRRMADRVLEAKASEYGIPKDEWHHDDVFERTRRLQDAVLGRLEIEYLGQIQTGYERRRAMNVRMVCFERLADSHLSPLVRLQIERDVEKTRELILMTPFSLAYRQKYGDLEMWVEYINRFRSALGMPQFNFGSQTVVFAVHEPINVHPIAANYSAMQTEDSQRDYLYSQTESLRGIVQKGVDEICRARRSPDQAAHT